MSEPADASQLAGLPLFAGLDEAALASLAAAASEEAVPAGRVLVREGNTGGSFFLVLDGRVRIERHGRRVAEIGPGEFVGEAALLDGVPRTATAIVSAPGRVVAIGARDFRALVERSPAVRERLEQAVAARPAHG